MHLYPCGALGDVHAGGLDRDLARLHLRNGHSDRDVELARVAEPLAIAAAVTLPKAATLSLAVWPARILNSKQTPRAHGGLPAAVQCTTSNEHISQAVAIATIQRLDASAGEGVAVAQMVRVVPRSTSASRRTVVVHGNQGFRFLLESERLADKQVTASDGWRAHDVHKNLKGRAA